MKVRCPRGVTEEVGFITIFHGFDTEAHEQCSTCDIKPREGRYCYPTALAFKDVYSESETKWIV